MTDKEYNKLLTSTFKALNKYQELLELSENEYVSRFGNHPNDIYDDNWIDIFNVGSGLYSFKSVVESAKFYNKE